MSDAKARIYEEIIGTGNRLLELTAQAAEGEEAPGVTRIAILANMFAEHVRFINDQNAVRYRMVSGRRVDRRSATKD